MPGMKEFKSLFEKPQNARLVIICALVALATVGAVIACIVYSTGVSADAPAGQSEAVSGAPAAPEDFSESGAPAESEAPTQNLMGVVPSLTIDQARELALADAGVAESEADVSREALSEDNGIWVYEFRFRTESARYEYKINANTGEVRGMAREVFVHPSAGVTESPAPAGESDPPAEDAPQTPDVTQPPASSPPDSTPDPSPTPDQPASMYIGISRAKTLALEHAGLSADQASFTRVRMDREQGTVVYRLEFRQGRVEYKYELDAATGRILDHKRNGN